MQQDWLATDGVCDLDESQRRNDIHRREGELEVKCVLDVRGDS